MTRQPCQHCGSQRGHTYVCPVPAIARTAKTLASLRHVSREVMVEALSLVNVEILARLSTLVSAELAARKGGQR